MTSHRPRRRWMRIRRIGLALLIVLPIGLVAGWLALRYIPSWYRPVSLSDQELTRVKGDIAERSEWVSHRMVGGAPFELILNDFAVNEWLAALPWVWPDASGSIPREIRDPAVRFEPGACVLAFHAERDGWEAIVSVRIEATVSEDGSTIDVHVGSVRGGAVRVPRYLVDRVLEWLGESQWRRGLEGDNQGIRIHNRFEWPNGDRMYRIDSIRFEDGAARIVLMPL